MSRAFATEFGRRFGVDYHGPKPTYPMYWKDHHGALLVDVFDRTEPDKQQVPSRDANP
jgi:hypothetical protein